MIKFTQQDIAARWQELIEQAAADRQTFLDKYHESLQALQAEFIYWSPDCQPPAKWQPKEPCLVIANRRLKEVRAMVWVEPYGSALYVGCWIIARSGGMIRYLREQNTKQQVLAALDIPSSKELEAFKMAVMRPLQMLAAEYRDPSQRV